MKAGITKNIARYQNRKTYYFFNFLVDYFIDRFRKKKNATKNNNNTQRYFEFQRQVGVHEALKIFWHKNANAITFQ